MKVERILRWGAVPVIVFSGILFWKSTKVWNQNRQMPLRHEPMTDSVDKTPSGGQLPAIWTYSEIGPEQIRVGQTFKVTVTLDAPLFDIAKVTITPFVTGSGVVCLHKSEPWSGMLPRGVTKHFEFELKAIKAGMAGQYGLHVASTSAFEEMRQYLNQQTSGVYASPVVKKDLLARVKAKIDVSPVCRDGYVAAVKVLTPEGNQ